MQLLDTSRQGKDREASTLLDKYDVSLWIGGATLREEWRQKKHEAKPDIKRENWEQPWREGQWWQGGSSSSSGQTWQGSGWWQPKRKHDEW